jgi:hypothetical protein
MNDALSLPRHASVLATLALLAIAALAWHGPIVQWHGYHTFADTRAWGGLPHALNVLSNLPFALAGLWAWPQLREAAAPWRAFCAAIAATSLGSSIYHLQPNDLTLLVDRLPIAWACGSLMCAFLAQRVHPAWGTSRVVAWAWLAGTTSVVWWGVGTALGAGDLRPYVLVQFLPMLLIPAALLLGMTARQPDALPAAAWWTALALYAGAKGLEAADTTVMAALGGLSGHSLKHLVAALAATLLLRSRAAQLR